MNAVEAKQMIDTILEMMVNPETGEVLEEIEALKIAEEYEATKLEKCEWMLKHITEEKYKIEAIKSHIRELNKMLKTKENSVDRLTKYVALALGYEKWETPDGLAKISYRTTKDKVTVDDIDLVPIEFFKTPRYESNLSKTDLKDAILGGEVIPGVHLEDSKSIIVKG